MCEEQLKPWPWDKSGESGYTITLGVTKNQADIIKILSRDTGSTPAGIIHNMISTMCTWESKLSEIYCFNHEEE